MCPERQLEETLKAARKTHRSTLTAALLLRAALLRTLENRAEEARRQAEAIGLPKVELFAFQMPGGAKC